MPCRACGATIAEKAIVCYKCGTPTADVPAVPRQGPTRLRRIPMLFAAVALITAAAAYLIPLTPEASWQRTLAWAAVPVITFLTVRLIRGPRSGTLRSQ